MSNLYSQYKSPFGYQVGDNGIDSYGVDHSGFSARDEIEYQTARDNRENQLMQMYNNQGITENYPQYGTNFWGDAGNNYGFGSSNISSAISTHPAMNTTLAPMQPMQTVTPRSDAVNAIRQKIFNGTDCGGMSAEFADKIAYAESRGGCRNNVNNYGCINNSGSAFGRYQMQPAALQDAGYINDKRQFLPETGINNMQEFLNNPSAQEQAMCNYMNRIDRYNQNWNNYKYLGKTVQIGNLNVPITKNMMLAGTHREGARKLNEWLNDITIQNQQLVRNPMYDRRDEKKRNITKRFEEILYPPK